MNKQNRLKNPMELYSEKTNENFIDVLKRIIKHDLMTEDEKASWLYELFCELHTDWKDSLRIK